MRKTSGPLDWVTGCDFKTVCSLLTSRFAFFLEKEDFAPFVHQDAKTYRNQRHLLIFRHDFMENVAFETIFDNVVQKYSRRINRFHTNIDSSRNVLLVYMSPFDFPAPFDNVSFSTENTLAYAGEVLASFPESVDFLIIRIHPEATPDIRQESERLVLITVPDNATAEALFSKLQVARTKRETLSLFWKDRLQPLLFLRLLPAFIPFPAARKRFRDKLKIKYKW